MTLTRGIRRTIWIAGGIIWPVVVWNAARVWRGLQVDPLPSLARGLPDSFADGDGEFKRRVRSESPIGSSEANLVSKLAQQGFNPVWERGVPLSSLALAHQREEQPLAPPSLAPYPTGNKDNLMWEVKDDLGNEAWVSAITFDLAK